MSSWICMRHICVVGRERALGSGKRAGSTRERNGTIACPVPVLVGFSPRYRITVLPPCLRITLNRSWHVCHVALMEGLWLSQHDRSWGVNVWHEHLCWFYFKKCLKFRNCSPFCVMYLCVKYTGYMYPKNLYSVNTCKMVQNQGENV